MVASKGGNTRYALVLGSGERCGFCAMIASRGFDYPRSSVFKPHNHCTCMWWPGIPGKTDIQGQSLKAYQHAVDDAKNTVGGTGPESLLQKEWDSLFAVEKVKYAERAQENLSGIIIVPGNPAYNEFCLERIAMELETRDAEWIRSGKQCLLSYPETRELKERKTAAWLCSHGFNVEGIETDGREFMKRAPDSWLNDERWEFKIPDGYKEFITVWNCFKKCVTKHKGVVNPQSNLLVISNAANHAKLEDMARDVLAIYEEGRWLEITEVILIGEEQMIRLIR